MFKLGASGAEKRQAAFITKDTLHTMKGMSLYFDSPAGKAVQVRLTIPRPAAATQDLFLAASVSGDRVNKIRAYFEKWYSNRLAIISFEQELPWGQFVDVAARVNLSGMTLRNLVFYSYDRVTHSFQRLSRPQYWVDNNGFIHFKTEYAGGIVISDGELAEKRTH